jgi:DNA-binding FadR family transcriptional regulator
MLTDNTRQGIIKLLLSGEVGPGQALPSEAELCERLGASRSRVREAIKYLQGKGLVKIEWGKGTIVQPFENIDIFDPDLWVVAVKFGKRDALIRDLVELRQVIEEGIVRIASMQRMEEDIEKLSTTLERMRLALQQGSIPEYNDADKDFHQGLADATHNVFIVHIAKSMHQVIDKAKIMSAYSLDTIERSFNGHLAIFEAIKLSDPDAAVKAMEEHLKEFESNFRKVLTLTSKERQNGDQG